MIQTKQLMAKYWKTKNYKQKVIAISKKATMSKKAAIRKKAVSKKKTATKAQKKV